MVAGLAYGPALVGSSAAALQWFDSTPKHEDIMNTDAKDLAQARARWNARKSSSSIIAWTLSPVWTMVSLTQRYRGYRNGIQADAFHGEITNAR